MQANTNRHYQTYTLSQSQGRSPLFLVAAVRPLRLAVTHAAVLHGAVRIADPLRMAAATLHPPVIADLEREAPRLPLITGPLFSGFGLRRRRRRLKLRGGARGKSPHLTRGIPNCLATYSGSRCLDLITEIKCRSAELDASVRQRRFHQFSLL